MRKSTVTFFLSLVLALSLITGCSAPAASTQTQAPATQAPATEAPATQAPAEPQPVTVTDSDGNDVTVMPSPTKVAIYDYSILDILYNIGFEKTGITHLIVPTKASLPADLAFYKEAGDDVVISGGSLFYVDWDVLDLVQPNLVITGARSFGMNAAGDRVSGEEKEKYISDTFSRYPEASFIKLSVNTASAQLVADMENNVAALAAIFPHISDELYSKLDDIKSGIADISERAQASGKTALFCMMVDQTTLSVFGPNSRFSMLYTDFGFTPADDGAVQWGDQHGFDVRAEYVLEKNPDVIFLLDRSATVGSGAGAENFMNDPIISQTDAAASGNIYTLTGDAWYTMTGGFTSAERMIEDINQFINTLE